MKSSNRKTNFSSQRTAIPFGKYESGSDDVFPCNESMVGREGARAKLIDFLTNAGTQKAILITGRRGMGKTSFVNYCIDEYKKARIERYWRSDIARTVSSWIWLLSICMFCAIAYVLGSWLFKALLDNAIEKGNHFLWILILPLLYSLSYLLLHAVEIFKTLFKAIPNISANFLGIAFVSLTVLVFIHIPILKSEVPAVMLSRFIVALTSMYFIGELIDFFLFNPEKIFNKVINLFKENIKNKLPDELIGFFNPKKPITKKEENKATNLFWEYIKNKRIGGFFLFLVGIIAGSCSFFYDSIITVSRYGSDGIGMTTFFSNLFVSSIFLGLATLNRAISLFRKPKHIKRAQISAALRKSYLWFGCVAIVFITLPFMTLPFIASYLPKLFFMTEFEVKFNCSSGWVPLLFSCFGLIFIIAKFFRKIELKSGKAANYRKRYVYSTALLSLKAIFFILLSLFALNSQLLDFFSLNPQQVGLTTKNDLIYIALITLIIIITVLVFWIEYEWIIRPAQTRRDQSMGGENRPGYYDDFVLKDSGLPQIKFTSDHSQNRKTARNEVQLHMRRQTNIRERSRNFEALTFIGYFKHLHLTTLVSTINLGFEELDHRSVIHAMLLDIREQYYEKFVSLSSPRVVVRSIFGLFLAMVLIAELTDKQFNPNQQENKTKVVGIPQFKTTLQFKDEKITFLEKKNLILRNKYCQKSTPSKNNQDTVDGLYENLPKIPRLLCELGGFYAETILPLIYFELIPIHLHPDTLLDSGFLSWPFDIRTPYYLCTPANQNDCTQDNQISFCVYHFFLFVFILYIFRRINRTFTLTPYRINLEKIDELLHALTSTTKTKSNRDFPIFVRIASALSGSYQENEKSTEREKLDPRLVELQFMNVLEKICHSRPIYFMPLQSGKHSPTIEITFVFDELDKLATDMNSQRERGDADGNDSELHRLNLMKGLLSNMKRIITSSEARYIFLGGRLLHDDWLADEARRQPLLTSIFSDEIYLPSLLTYLLTDANIDWFNTEKESSSNKSPNTHSLHTRIEEYLVWQYYLARMRFEDGVIRIWSPLTGLPEWDKRNRGFIQVSYKRLKNLMKDAVKDKRFPDSAKTPLHTLTIRNTFDGKHLNEGNLNSGFEFGRLSAFIHFLAYRSAGNPKRLNELLASFVMSADRAIDDKVGRDEGFNCQDVLYLPDHKVMRIQLIDRVYRQLSKGFEEKIRGRDDKTITALIYLSDFLFKFHDRAFSWKSLELIDELMHMHRGHDLRMLLHELVEHYTDRYLHRIINGMYTYRFRGYFANEIEYLSHHSEEEMAAFNFTLDESQTLRSHLEDQLDSGDNRDKTDILSMLGELHEFYQEYETARQYYRRCIHARLPMITEHIGNTVGKDADERSVIHAIYTNKLEGREALLALQQWGPMTLRWFLQIVMTYEREHNFNHALIRYERYITFAECMIQAFATEESEKVDSWFNITPSQKNSSTDHAYVLEYLGLLFEPLFAYAWLLEKNSYTNGNSHFVLDEGIKKYEEILNKDVTNPEFMGFVKAQWKKKIGALCFYKGLATTKQKTKEKTKEKTNANHVQEGYEDKTYINRALDYYSESAIQLSLYFRKGVGTKFNEKSIAKTLTEAFLTNQYPTDYCFSVAECLGDLSESILGEIDPVELFKTPKTYINSIHKQKDFEQTAITLIQQLDKYFFDSDRNENKRCILNLLAKLNYIGRYNFGALNLIHKYDLALNLALASSFYMVRAGYVESAARGAMHTVEVIAQYFNWYWFNFVTNKIKTEQHWQGFCIVPIVMKKVIWYSDYLLKLFRSARSETNQNSDGAASSEESYLIGELIPSSALTSLCSTGMSLSFFLRDNHSDPISENVVQHYMNELSTIIDRWTKKEEPPHNRFFINKYTYFEKKLIYSIQRHRYPVLNQLNALKTLVDSSLVRGYLSEDDTATQNTGAWLQELYHINKKYNHPFHFTPMQSGQCFYLYWYLNQQKNVNDQLNLPKIDDFDLHTEFRHSLIQSLDMCHMGRGYYEAINNMYYLFDDFNDNQIHRNHAMQMAGTELTKMALKNEDKNQKTK
ncbi:MAG: hypothetical protein V3U87_00240 [Methylococcaceae bacterium]